MMHPHYTNIFMALVCISMLGFPLSVSHAYVLEGNHILYLTAKNLKSRSKLSVAQILTIYQNGSHGTTAELEETVHYEFPDQFRSDLVFGQTVRVHVFSKGKAVTIINDSAASDPESGMDHFKDPLLFRNWKLLEERLSLLGVDTSISSLGRFKDRICYIVGAKYPDETLPQVWVDKETFLPVRYLLVEQSVPNIDSIIEFRYLNWMETDKTWYPMRVEAYVNEKPVRTIEVKHIETNPVFEKNLFDIPQLRSVYPSSIPQTHDLHEEDDLEKVQQSIEDFKKRFE